MKPSRQHASSAAARPRLRTSVTARRHRRRRRRRRRLGGVPPSGAASPSAAGAVKAAAVASPSAASQRGAALLRSARGRRRRQRAVGRMRAHMSAQSGSARAIGSNAANSARAPRSRTTTSRRIRSATRRSRTSPRPKPRELRTNRARRAPRRRRREGIGTRREHARASNSGDSVYTGEHLRWAPEHRRATISWPGVVARRKARAAAAPLRTRLEASKPWNVRLQQQQADGATRAFARGYRLRDAEARGARDLRAPASASAALRPSRPTIALARLTLRAHCARHASSVQHAGEPRPRRISITEIAHHYARGHFTLVSIFPMPASPEAIAGPGTGP